MSASSPTGFLPWRHGGWSGFVDPAVSARVREYVDLAEADGGRRSRHATTRRADVAGRLVWVKTFRAPGERFARRAVGMHAALTAAGCAVPRVVAVGWRSGEGVLVTDDVGGVGLIAAVAGARRERRRLMMDQLGQTVARLHEAGFVAGDLVPSNVFVRGDEMVLLDHDRTRRSRLLVWWNGRRNLVQLGRFVVPRVGLTDRARVLRGYARGRGWGRRRRRRLARWLVAKIRERRIRFDGITSEVARTVGFGELMQSGGRWDPGRGGE